MFVSNIRSAGAFDMNVMNLCIPPAQSITHQHITAVINTLLGPALHSGPVRILDVGCGNGQMLSHMLSALSLLRPNCDFHVFGLDVFDAGQQQKGYMRETRRYLGEQWPSVNWKERLSLISTSEAWPYPDSSFDFITSNQVMEHVMDHDSFFFQTRRCLRPPWGVSINLFPVRQILFEGHALMPFVHKIKDENTRARLMLLFAKLGFRKHYYLEMRRRGWTSLEEYAQVFAHVLQTDTKYVTVKELVAKAEDAGLRTSFTFTKDFFVAKALSYFRNRPYKYRDAGFLESMALFVFKYLSSVTVLFRKAE